MKDFQGRRRTDIAGSKPMGLNNNQSSSFESIENSDADHKRQRVRSRRMRCASPSIRLAQVDSGWCAADHIGTTSPPGVEEETPTGSSCRVLPAAANAGISRFACSESRNLTSSRPWLGSP